MLAPWPRQSTPTPKDAFPAQPHPRLAPALVRRWHWRLALRGANSTDLKSPVGYLEAKRGKRKLGDFLHCLRYVFGRCVYIIGLKAPGNYLDRLWSNEISVVSREGPESPIP